MCIDVDKLNKKIKIFSFQEKLWKNYQVIHHEFILLNIS